MSFIHISPANTFKKGRMAMQALVVLLAAQSVTSCKKLVEADVPKNLQTQQAVFTTNTTANAAVNGMYSAISGTSFLNGPVTQMMGLSADEFYFSAARDAYDQFTANTISFQANNDNLSLWSSPYSVIYQANSIIEGLALPSSLVADSLKRQYTAEARLVRGLCHFYLTNMYGKVPLITTTNINITASQPRNTVDEVYTKILEDLTYAENNLAKDYRYSPTAGDRTRVNRWAASALLARAYLYRGQWAQAAQYASKVIDSAGIYSLADITASSPFYKNNAEAIWQYYSSLQPTTGYTAEGTMFRPTAASVACYALRPELLNSFEAGDKRKQSWTMSANITVAGVTNTYTVPLKYKNNSATVSYTGGALEGLTPLRLAEQYLIRAEALARLGRVTEGAADLNRIRRRAGLEDVNPADATALLTAVAKERRIELFAEMGHRWLDLKRTNTADAVLKVLKQATWKATAVLYPVPEEAYRSNPALLPQNDGY